MPEPTPGIAVKRPASRGDGKRGRWFDRAAGFGTLLVGSGLPALAVPRTIAAWIQLGAQPALQKLENGQRTATGHTDTSGLESHNMALSLRRANAVKDALVRDGVPAQAIVVIGKGEVRPLTPTGDGVREPQNRRVEIVAQ